MTEQSFSSLHHKISTSYIAVSRILATATKKNLVNFLILSVAWHTKKHMLHKVCFTSKGIETLLYKEKKKYEIII